MIGRCLVLWSIFFLSACSSVPPLDSASLPDHVRAAASRCEGREGTYGFQIYDDGALLISSDLEWISSDKGWQAELLDPIGRKLFDIKYAAHDSVVEAGGALISKIPEVTIEDGYLHVDGTRVAVRPEEVPCLLSGVYPLSWLQSVVAIEYQKNSVLTYFSQSSRTMRVVQKNNTQLGEKQRCVAIEWRAMLGLIGREIELCTHDRPDFGGRLTFGGYELRWIDIE